MRITIRTHKAKENHLNFIFFVNLDSDVLISKNDMQNITAKGIITRENIILSMSMFTLSTIDNIELENVKNSTPLGLFSLINLNPTEPQSTHTMTNSEAMQRTEYKIIFLCINSTVALSQIDSIILSSFIQLILQIYSFIN